MDAPLTRADIIAKIREHFSEPGAQLAYADSYGETYQDPDAGSGVCVYRMDGDPLSSVRCAMGVLIPDDRYEPIMEGTTADVLVTGGKNFGIDIDLGDETPIVPSLGDLFAESEKEFRTWLNGVQQAHDDTAREGGSVAVFLARLDKIEV